MIAGHQHRHEVGGVGREPEEQEEHRGEQIAQRREHALRVLGGRARDRDPDQERAHRRGDVRPRGEPGDQEREAEHRQQQHVGFLRPHQPRHELAVAQGHVEDQDHRRQRDHDRDDAGAEVHADQERGQHRQVEGHREVFDHEDRQHDGRLAVRQATEVVEHLGDDARGGDPRDAGHHDRGDRPPAEQQRDQRARDRVQEHVDQARRLGRLQVADELLRGVLQAEHEQQQDHADLGADLDELLALRERAAARPRRTRARR